MNLGDNLYKDHEAKDPKFSFLKRYASAGDDASTVYKSEVDNLKNKADFYGDQAEAYGDSAASKEGGGSGASAASIGSAMAKGGSPVDMASNGLMASGNPYAMAAGGILKVAGMGQQREQAKLNANRAAFIDRQNKMREISDKLLSNNFAV